MRLLDEGLDALAEVRLIATPGVQKATVGLGEAIQEAIKCATGILASESAKPTVLRLAGSRDPPWSLHRTQGDSFSTS